MTERNHKTTSYLTKGFIQTTFTVWTPCDRLAFQGSPVIPDIVLCVMNVVHASYWFRRPNAAYGEYRNMEDMPRICNHCGFGTHIES